MISEIQRRLVEQLADIDSVRGARMGANGLLIVFTWSGVVIHVYLIDAPIKARAIKKIVQENTRVGIGTLLLIDAAIVPDDGARVTPDEGLIALHALFKDKVYTYRLEDDDLRIGQVHFKAFNRGDEREVWYGPDVHVHHLPSYRVWVSAPQSIKGNWLIAHFGSDSFWKSADYSAGRDAFRQQQRRSTGSTEYRTWSRADWGLPGSEAYTTPATPPESQLDRSYRQLGLTREASGAEVKAAFRRLAREVHPDVSELPKAEAEARFKLLYEAYSYIKTTNGW